MLTEQPTAMFEDRRKETDSSAIPANGCRRGNGQQRASKKQGNQNWYLQTNYVDAEQASESLKP